MTRTDRYEHCFVESAPRELEHGVLYVSVRFATALHRCACGCGSRIVTPFSPTDWKMTFDGESISLHPSIGNWSLPCRSHYFIRRNQVQWAGDWTEKQVRSNRQIDRDRKRPLSHADERFHSIPTAVAKPSWVRRVYNWIRAKR